MRRVPKKIFGFLGLVFVVAMTAFAATLPGPEASATSSSVTDVITVRVLAETPDVNITSPISGTSYVDPNQIIEFDFNNVGQVTAILEYTDTSGATSSHIIYDEDAGLQPGSVRMNIDLSGPDYGYGDYKLTVTGQGKATRGQRRASTGDEDIVTFSYIPITATVDENDTTGKIYTTIIYDDNNVDIDHFVINVYDGNGRIVSALSPIVVSRSDSKKVELPFAEKNIPEGEYTISVSAFNMYDVMLHRPYNVVFTYKPIQVPDTGGVLVGLNISKADYLVTGLLIFSITGIGGLLFIAKGKKNQKQR